MPARGECELGMDREKFQAALDKHVDPATGKRRVTSLSKLRVPEQGLSGNMEDQRAAGIIEARMSGSEQLPRKLSPSHGACSCGAAAWEDCEPRECSVYGRTFVQSATWHNLRCRSALAQERVLGQVEESARLRMRAISSRVLARRACKEVRGYDGSEDCLLLQTARVSPPVRRRPPSASGVLATSLSLPGGRMPGVHRVAQLPAWLIQGV